MAADYAGAVKATTDRFKSQWVDDADAELTPVEYANNSQPRLDGKNTFAKFEVVSLPSYKSGAGKPGAGIVVYPGLIKVHILVAAGTGTDAALALAVRAGEIFRNQLFYDDVTPGCYVRSGFDLNGQPRIEEGELDSQDGSWFAITATVPFEYRHRA